jgi:hypothetical protein
MRKVDSFKEHIKFKLKERETNLCNLLGWKPIEFNNINKVIDVKSRKRTR